MSPAQPRSNVEAAHAGLDASRKEEAAKAAREAQELEQSEAKRHNEALRRPLYVDIEALINPGFLSEPFELGGVVWSLRSLSPGDLVRIRNCLPLDSTGRDWKEWCLAISVWMIDGYIVLDQPNVAPLIRKQLRKLPKNIIDILWSILHGLFNRVSAALPKVESYCYESHSRVSWRFCGKGIPSREEITGVPGTSRLGMNIIQRMWVSYNMSEDEREADLRSWNAAKLVASSNSPKGIKKLNASDESRYRAEEMRRQKTMDQLYFEHIGWKSADEHENLSFQPHTADELVEQMRRWKDGELDFHDIVVRNWKAKIRELEDEKRMAMKQRAEERRRKQEEAMASGETSSLVGYTQDQLDELLKGKGFRRTRRVTDTSDMRDKYDKYLTNNDIGYFSPQGVVPDPDQGSTLSDQVAGRKTLFRSEVPDYVPDSLKERFAQDLSKLKGEE